MKTKKPLSIRVIYWLTQIIFGLSLFALVIAIAMNIVLQFELLGDDMQLHTLLPVEVNYCEKGSVYMFGETKEIEFVEATGKIHYINTHPTLSKIFGGLLLGVIGILIYIIVMFRRFIGNVYRNLVFERFNISMLKKMAYGLVALWAFMIVYSRVFYHYIVTNMDFEHLEITSEQSNYGGILFIALILWVLSHIFMSGVKLKDEQNLTV